MRTKILTDKQVEALEGLMQAYGYTLTDIANICGFATHASVLQKLNQLTGFSELQLNAIIERSEKILTKHLYQKEMIIGRCKKLGNELEEFKRIIEHNGCSI